MTAAVLRRYLGGCLDTFLDSGAHLLHCGRVWRRHRRHRFPKSPTSRFPISSSFRPTCIWARLRAWPSTRRDMSSSSRAATPPDRPTAPAAAQILEFGPDGKYIREIGHNLYAWSFAHAIRFDKDDNLWAVDKGSDMIIKFNPEGRVVMVFGRKKEASDEGTEPWKHPKPPLPAINGQFRQPTDVTWDTQGNIFISDGYINSRVAKFDKNGDWVKQWGTPGSGPGRVQHAAQHRVRCARQHLRGRSRQPAHPGFRSRWNICCARSPSMCRFRPSSTCGWAIPRPPLHPPPR